MTLILRLSTAEAVDLGDPQIIIKNEYNCLSTAEAVDLGDTETN